MSLPGEDSGLLRHCHFASECVNKWDSVTDRFLGASKNGCRLHSDRLPTYLPIRIIRSSPSPTLSTSKVFRAPYYATSIHYPDDVSNLPPLQMWLNSRKHHLHRSPHSMMTRKMMMIIIDIDHTDQRRRRRHSHDIRE